MPGARRVNKATPSRKIGDLCFCICRETSVSFSAQDGGSLQTGRRKGTPLMGMIGERNPTSKGIWRLRGAPNSEYPPVRTNGKHGRIIVWNVVRRRLILDFFSWQFTLLLTCVSYFALCSTILRFRLWDSACRRTQRSDQTARVFWARSSSNEIYNLTPSSTSFWCTCRWWEKETLDLNEGSTGVCELFSQSDTAAHLDPTTQLCIQWKTGKCCCHIIRQRHPLLLHPTSIFCVDRALVV